MRRITIFLPVFAALASAQVVRVTIPVDTTRRTTLPLTAHRLARSESDLGPVEPTRQIPSLVLLLKPSPRQQAEMDTLLAQQQDPASPNFHKWLTPERYADRFGLHPNDLAAARSWLESQGLTIDHSARGRNWIGFSGTAGLVQKALGTQIHRYLYKGEEHLANATDLSVPAAFEPIAGGFLGLNDLHARPLMTNPDGSHSIAPDDLAIIYDIMPLYNSGIDGTGMKIAIVGKSDLEPNLADIHAFRTQFNLPGADPQLIRYGADPGLNGSVGEADLDIEWAGAVARNAQLLYVYGTDVFVATTYAVDQNLAPVISYSYAGCEQVDAFVSVISQSIVQQGNSQGITFVAGSGDAGPANCDDWSYEPVATNGLGVAWPASIPEVTAVGGTSFNDSSGTYWNPTNTANGASAISYIPEKAWNETAADGVLLASGGGASVLYPKPPWQTGPGVPNDGVRDVPDVAMPAAAFVSCSGGACVTNGRGTSYATPIFAGIVALINQSLVKRGVQAQPGLGNINPALYRMAQATSNAFHDVTTGNTVVPCETGTLNCTTGSIGFNAGPGYDLTTGLGSLDVANLVNQWNAGGIATTLSVTASKTSFTMSDTTQLTIAVTGASGKTTPTGNIFVNQSNTPITYGNAPGDVWLGSAALTPSGAGAAATLTVYPGQVTAGSDTILVTYSGDATFNGSSATLPVTVTVPSGHSAVVATSTGNCNVILASSVATKQPVCAGNGTFGWGISVQIQEVAGVATTLTNLMVTGGVNGTDDYSPYISTFFGSGVIPAHGTLIGAFPLNVASPPSTITITLSGQDANGYRWTTRIPMLLVGAPQQFVATQVGGGLVNAASFQHAYAPGMILSVYGSNLTSSSSATGTAQSLPLPLSLAGASATINGVAAPYYYASPSQTNIQIPYETQPGLAILTLTGALGQTYNYSFNVQPSAPGIFVDSTNNAPVPSETGSPGGTVVMFITGEGQVTPALATGASPSPTTPLANLPHPVLPVTVAVGGLSAQIAFIGVVPGIAGATQINYVLPANVPSGPQPVVVTVGTIASPPAMITIKP